MRGLALLLTLLGASSVWAQGLYQDDHIPEVHIYFAEDNWDVLLDALYVEGLQNRLECTVTVDGESLPYCGIRYKGYSSASVDFVKNPFNIKINYTLNDAYQGFDKIKLSNVIHDPSFVREALSYEIARTYMPAPLANFARVYINDAYWGLYTNVQSVDKEFLEMHFAHDQGALIKGNPDTVDLFGENANLSDSPGTDSLAYASLYDMRTTHGWAELVGAIDVLNNNPTQAADAFNVDRALWMHAVNYTLVNLDSYIGYAQNYYLYQASNGRFQPILWDMNMSIGSFKLTDASDNFDGFTATQAQTLDPLAHYNSFSVFPRPLMRNLFEQDTYRRQYLAHIRTITEEWLSSGLYLERATFYQDLIADDVAADVNKFYSTEDFTTNLTESVTEILTYPGITELLDNRATYLETYPGFAGYPTVETPELLGVLAFDQPLTITAAVSNATYVYLGARAGKFEVFDRLEMNDAGLDGDVVSGDGVYSVTIEHPGNVLQYYVYAENDEAGAFLPQRAEYEFFETTATVTNQAVVINEFMPENQTFIYDAEGNFEDWIEFYNTSDAPVNLRDHLLSDDVSSWDWTFPDVVVAPDSYLIVWCDTEGNNEYLHADFELNELGEQILLGRPDGSYVDSFNFPATTPDESWSRSPNGSGDFVVMNTTFNAPNTPLGITSPGAAYNWKVYPNPSNGLVTIAMPGQQNVTIHVLDQQGRRVATHSLASGSGSLDLAALPAGHYLLNIAHSTGFWVSPLILQH